MITRPAPLLILHAVLAAACTDSLSTPVALPPPPGASGDGVLVECRAIVAAARMSCAPVAAAGGASADMLLGGQNTYVQLHNDSITVANGVFSTAVTVQNLTVQALGTGDGTTVSPSGVRVFFHQEPTNGVRVANPDGLEMYTGPAQPYFQYDGVLHPQQVSASRTWRFDLDGETDSFAFQVLVVAAVPSETGFLRMRQVAGSVTRNGASGVWMDSSTVIAVGSRILRSLDGGVQWTVQGGGASRFLRDVWGQRPNVVAVGWGGAIVRSTNRGGTWHHVSSGTSANLRGVWGHGSTIVAVGGSGVIVRSTDGGATWSGTASGTTEELRDVWGQDSTFVAVGDRGTIVLSTNAGATWASVESGVAVTLYAVWGEGERVVVGGTESLGTDENGCPEVEHCGTILRSSDGGATWVPSSIADTENAVQALWGSGSTILAGIGSGGLGTGGEIYRSTDGGASWTRAQSEASYHQGIMGIAGWGPTVIAVGANERTGLIFRSTDAGVRWSSLGPHDPVTRTGTWSDGGTAIVVSTDWSILRSTDGGATWSFATNPPRVDLLGVWGEGATAVAVGGLGKAARSTDRGARWDSVRTGTTRTLRDVSGTGQTVVAVGDSGTIRRSTDGGVTWDGAASGTTQHLAAIWIQGSTAIAVGASGTMLRSVDTGATWLPVASGTSQNLTGVWGADSTMVAVATGGHLQRSTDGGLSWTPVSTGTAGAFTDVSGHGSTVVATFAAADSSATVLRSNDAGATWHALNAGVDGVLRSLWMVSPVNVIAAGDQGLVLRGTR